MKDCAKCKLNLPDKAFYVRRGSGCGLSSHCKKCTKESNRKRLAEKPEMAREHSRRHARTIGGRFTYSKAISRCAGWSWSLSESEYSVLVCQSCHYCGFALTPTGIGLDRKDSERGYEIDNVVPCCRECNVAKNTWFTYEEMLIIGPAIRVVKLNRFQGVSE